MRMLGAARVLLVFATLTAPGCLSSFPLDPSPEKPVDPRILGLWRCLPSDADASEEPATLTISQESERTYSVTFEVKGENASRYDGFSSTIRDQLLVNLHDLDPRALTSPWDYARYTLLLPNVLQIKLVRDTLLKDVEQTPAAFREVLQKHIDEDALYGDFCVCVRARPSDAGDAPAERP